MFLNIPLIADWHAITQKREHLIHENLIQEKQEKETVRFPSWATHTEEALETA